MGRSLLAFTGPAFCQHSPGRGACWQMRAQASSMNRIGAWRIYRGLTQRELGQRVGVSGTTIHNWEGNRAMPDAPQLARLCLALRCGLKDLYPDG